MRPRLDWAAARPQVKAIAVLLAALSGAIPLAGATACAPASTSTTGTTIAGSAKTTIRIGTLPTEDALPLWVAQLPQPITSGSSSAATSSGPSLAEKAGIDLQIITFPSAQERDAALVAGKIDGFMGDIIAAANMLAKGTPVTIVTTMLGADPTQGRFGIVVPKTSPIRSVAQLKGVPIATSSNTITEYVIDRVLANAGFRAADIKTIEIKKIPLRMELLLAGKIQAAALPDPLLAFAQSQGARLIVDDTNSLPTTGGRVQNLSQTVLVMSSPFRAKNRAAMSELLAVLGEAVTKVNAAPETFRQLLVDKAKLPAPIAKTYKINVYPQPQAPTKEEVDAVLSWMLAKGLIPPGRVDYTALVAQPIARP